MAIKFESERIPCTAVNHSKCDFLGGRLPEVVAYVNRTTKESCPRSGPGTSKFKRMQLHVYMIWECLHASRKSVATAARKVPCT